ncbi:hypothetical protein [Bizionia gelidisalsuginis]|uniref:hypothetical protein n=1 Tax=Bizionia gelidisalsuginis TaxID=291188 RepID=UPI001FE63238|nr:hypothetical protein [Bizionia gelidisalsuginis]
MFACPDLHIKITKLKKNSLWKLIGINILLIITITFIGSIWYYYQPELVTTKIGIILTILAMIVFLISYNRQLPLLSKNKTEPNSKEYLKQLIKLKEIQIFQQTTMLSVYFIILSLGIGLYIFESVSKMTITWGVITYVITILWFAINWFYLRPKAIKKQNAKLNKLLVKFKKLNNQMISEVE